jgi:translation initiation factor 2B subunit (eIF-2B alpha/beta/delta family)
MHNCSALVAPGQTVMTLSYSSSLAKGIALAAKGSTRPGDGTSSSRAAGSDAAAGRDQSAASSSGAAAEEPSARGIKAFVCESRPLCEGLQLSAKLAQAGVQTTVITDAQGALFTQQCDMVLLGSDAITAGGVVNKVGSLQLALAARHYGKLVYAVADTYKLSPGPVSDLTLPAGCQAAKLQPEGSRRQSLLPSEQLKQQQEQELPQLLEDKGRQEVEAAWAQLGYRVDGLSDVSVGNVYFEQVPWQLLDGVVTEQGVLGAGELDRLVAARRQEYLLAFRLHEYYEPEQLQQEKAADE